jgi:Mce-associated membrane protein
MNRHLITRLLGALLVIAIGGSVVLVVHYATRSTTAQVAAPVGPGTVPSIAANGAFVPGSLPSATGAAAVAAASREVPALLSYDYRDLSGGLASALANATGAFRTSFMQTFTTKIEPTATTDHDVASSSVRAASYVSSSNDNAVTCLLFLDQSVVRTKPPAGVPPRQVDEDRVVVTMTDVGGHWLISALTPV